MARIPARDNKRVIHLGNLGFSELRGPDCIGNHELAIRFAEAMRCTSICHKISGTKNLYLSEFARWLL